MLPKEKGILVGLKHTEPMGFCRYRMTNLLTEKPTQLCRATIPMRRSCAVLWLRKDFRYQLPRLIADRPEYEYPDV